MAEPAPDPACRDVVELVTDYLDDALPAAHREGVERHLAGCRGCAAFLARVRAVIRLAASVDGSTGSTVPATVRDRLQRSYRAAVAGGPAGAPGGR